MIWAEQLACEVKTVPSPTGIVIMSGSVKTITGQKRSFQDQTQVKIDLTAVAERAGGVQTSQEIRNQLPIGWDARFGPLSAILTRSAWISPGWCGRIVQRLTREAMRSAPIPTSSPSRPIPSPAKPRSA